MSKLTALLLLASVVLASCDGGSGSTAPTPTTASPTPTPSTPTVQSPAPIPRTVGNLKKALLGLKDLPKGFKVVLDQLPGDDGMSVSSKDPKCARLIEHFETIQPPASQAVAYRAFARGERGPYVELQLDSLGSPAAVGALQADYLSAIRSCPRLTFHLSGTGSSPLRVTEIAAPQRGTGPFAVRFTPTTGRLVGYTLTEVVTSVDDILLTMTYIAAGGYDIDGTTKAAVDKVKATLVR